VRQFQHRVLHGIERVIIVAQRNARDPERTTFDTAKKALQLTSLIQNPFLRR
jgi:hypothetical protein